MSPQHTAVEVADKIIRLSLDEENHVTPMQVQKLTYFCHAWMLGLGHGPLFQDAVESWRHGPVIRSLYHALKGYGSSNITNRILRTSANFTDIEERVIGVVWRKYGKLDGLTLSGMTHADGSPWHQTYQRDRRSQIIHTNIIRDYHANLIEESRRA